MWDLSGPGLEPVSLPLAGGFLTIAPPGKSHTPSHFKSETLPIPHVGTSFRKVNFCKKIGQHLLSFSLWIFLFPCISSQPKLPGVRASGSEKRKSFSWQALTWEADIDMLYTLEIFSEIFLSWACLWVAWSPPSCWESLLYPSQLANPSLFCLVDVTPPNRFRKLLVHYHHPSAEGAAPHLLLKEVEWESPLALSNNQYSFPYPIKFISLKHFSLHLGMGQGIPSISLSKIFLCELFWKPQLTPDNFMPSIWCQVYIYVPVIPVITLLFNIIC